MGSFKKFLKKAKKVVKKVGKAVAAPTKSLVKSIKGVPVVGDALGSALDAQAKLTTGNVSSALKSASQAALKGAPIAAGVGLAAGGATYANQLAKGAIPKGLSGTLSQVENLTGKAEDYIGKAGRFGGALAASVQKVVDATRPFVPPSDPEPELELDDAPGPSAPRGGGGGGGGFMGSSSSDEPGGMTTQTKLMLGAAAVVVVLVMLNRKGRS